MVPNNHPEARDADNGTEVAYMAGPTDAPDMPTLVSRLIELINAHPLVEFTVTQNGMPL